jgi:hypothetical protein
MVSLNAVKNRVPFTADELAAIDISTSGELDALTKAYARKLQSLAHSREYAAEHPAEPIPAELMIKARAEALGRKVGKCPELYIAGHDDNGHRFGKEIYCGREWCPVCGKKDSVAHLRRFARWLPKAQTCDSLGLMVIEWPLASRDKVRKRTALEYYGKLAKRVLTGEYEVVGRRHGGDILARGRVAEIKAKYWDRGLRRWHYFGDIEHELKHLGLAWLSDKPASVFMPRVKSNVHLNILLPAGFIPKPWLQHVIATLRHAFNEPELIVHYGYTKEPGRMVHLLKYTTRATFLDYKLDEYLAGQLYRFRNAFTWGRWSGPELWSLADLPPSAKRELKGVNIEAVNSLAESVCPECKLPIRWSKPRPIAELRQTKDKRKLGAGYYRLPDVKPCIKMAESVSLRWQRLITGVLAEDRRADALTASLARIHTVAEAERQAEADYATWVAKRFCPPVVSSQVTFALGSYEVGLLGGGGQSSANRRIE